MAVADELAEWIIANKSKRGTPEFNTVASALEELASTPIAPLFTTPEPEKEQAGFLSALRESATTLGLADEAAAWAANPTEENRKAFLAAGASKYESAGGFGADKGLAKNWQALKELAGGSLGFLAAPAAAGLVTGGVGAGATLGTQYTIENLKRQAEEQEKAISKGEAPTEVSVGKAAVGAAASTALDIGGMKLLRPLFSKFPGLNKLLGGADDTAVKETGEALEEAIRTGKYEITKGGVFKGVGKGVAIEMPQEIAQQALERWQAGLSLTDEEAREEYKQAAIGAALLGAPMGGAGAALEQRANKALAEEKLGQEKAVGEEKRVQEELAKLYPGGQQLELLAEDQNFPEATDVFNPNKPTLSAEEQIYNRQQEYLASITDKKKRAEAEKKINDYNKKVAKENKAIEATQEEAIAVDTGIPLAEQKAKYDLRTAKEIEEANAAVQKANKPQPRDKDGKIIEKLSVPQQTSLFDTTGEATTLAKPAPWADKTVTILTPEVTKSLGLGPLNPLHKKLAGKNIKNPKHAAAVMAELVEYANKKDSASEATQNISKFLERPEFKYAEQVASVTAAPKQLEYSPTTDKFLKPTPAVQVDTKGVAITPELRTSLGLDEVSSNVIKTAQQRQANEALSSAQQQVGDLFPKEKLEAGEPQTMGIGMEEQKEIPSVKSKQKELFTSKGKPTAAADIQTESRKAWDNFGPEGIAYQRLTPPEKDSWAKLYNAGQASIDTAYKLVGRDAEQENLLKETPVNNAERTIHRQKADQASKWVDVTAGMLSPEYAAEVKNKIGAVNARVDKFLGREAVANMDDKKVLMLATEVFRQLSKIYKNSDIPKQIQKQLGTVEGARALVEGLYAARMAALINAYRVEAKERARSAVLPKNKGKKGADIPKTEAQKKAEEAINHPSVLPEERQQAKELAAIPPSKAEQEALNYITEEGVGVSEIAGGITPKPFIDILELLSGVGGGGRNYGIFTETGSETPVGGTPAYKGKLRPGESSERPGYMEYVSIDPKTGEQTTKYKKLKYAPKYKGAELNTDGKNIVQAGNLPGVLNHLISIAKNPISKQLLTRIRSLGLKTKIVMGDVSEYDPNTDTITIASNEVSEHILTHELLHAAISHVLRNPELKVTKALNKLFGQIHNQLGDAYGASDIQEFVAELGSSAEFQAILKNIKAPKSGSLWNKIVQTLAEFFGFRKGQSAFNAGLKLINDALDISGDIEPSPGAVLYAGLPSGSKLLNRINASAPSLSGDTLQNTQNFLSNMDSDTRRLALKLLRLDNMNTIYGKELPIEELLSVIELRSGAKSKEMEAFKTQINKIIDIVSNPVNRKFERTMSEMALDVRNAGINLLDPNFKPSTAQLNEYNRLKGVYNRLPKDMQNVYKEIVVGFQNKLNQFRDSLIANSAGDVVLQADIRQKFKTLIEKNPSYVPAIRHGDYKVEFVDPDTNERAAVAFSSERERAEFVKFLEAEQSKTNKDFGIDVYKDIVDESKLGKVLPSSTLGKIVANMQKSNATAAQIRMVRDAYFEAFPANSILQRFRKYKKVVGMEADIVSAYKETMPTWINKINNSTYLPEINKAIYAIQATVNAKRGSKDPKVQQRVEVLTDVANEISRQGDFFRNPVFAAWVRAGTQLSFFEFLVGNISSVLVNLTALPMFVTPILGGRFGYNNTRQAMTKALADAHNWYNRKGNYVGSPKYAALHDLLKDHDQLGGMAENTIKDSTQTPITKTISFLAIPFGASEKYNRVVTAITAYELALAGNPALGVKPMNTKDAANYALQQVKNLNTSGLIDTAPAFAQSGIGRTFYTFKSYIWNSAFVLARAWYQAFKGESKQVRREAAKQLIGVYAMAAMFAGAKGLPFMGATSVLAGLMTALINALSDDEEEPLDFDAMMREFFGELGYKGPVNYYTNLEIANRTGVANDLVFRDNPRGVADHGYILEAVAQVFGPAFGYILNAGDALKLANEGHVYRAAETFAPSFLKNGFKAYRFMEEGATTLKGDPLDTDINGWNVLTQLAGFSPADLSLAYEETSMKKKVESRILERRKYILDLINAARTAGDSQLLQEALERANKFSIAYPNLRIDGRTLERSRKARIAARENLINGVAFNPKLRDELDKMFEEEE